MRFHSTSVAEHAEAPLADEGRLEALTLRFEGRDPRRLLPSRVDNADYVVSIPEGDDPRARAAQLDEIVKLVTHQGDAVVGCESLPVRAPSARTLLGKGAALAVAERARAAGANMLVLDRELSPSQARNLEDEIDMAVCDREAVILNVFHRHARTRRARAQVEIAQLRYLRPRIRGVGLSMDQQTGGMARARGPGETASELLARKLDGRIAHLEGVVADLATSAETQRTGRADVRRVALVGYTNAGKTSLMNALTGAGLSACDAPFETLDTTSRCLTRHGGAVVLSDTVGFVRRLPDRLLTSFASTLAEVTSAHLLVLVIDASDPERELHVSTTDRVLAQLGAAGVPRLYVWNKADRLGIRPSQRRLDAASGGHPWQLVSSRDASQTAALGRAIVARARADEATLTLHVPYGDAEATAKVYSTCRVLESRADERGVWLTVSGPASALAALRGKARVHA